ncbi:unnamed protein product, partial [Owenia fusiformis]
IVSLDLAYGAVKQAQVLRLQKRIKNFQKLVRSVSATRKGGRFIFELNSKLLIFELEILDRDMESIWTIKLFLGLLAAWSLLYIAAEAGYVSSSSSSIRSRRSNSRRRYSYVIRYGRERQCYGLPAERQSPIDIETSATKCLWKLGRMYIPKYTCKDVHLVNDGGHTAQLELDKCDYTIQGGPLVGQYSVLQAHFHWGEESTRGSEHTLDGQRYPMEVHIVTKMRRGNSSCAELAVLGFFFQISYTDNRAWNDIIMGLGEITNPDEETILDNINLQKLLPRNRFKYYSYFGSLTTPPFSQIVKWTVFEETIKISEMQIAQFRTLLNEEGDNIVDNFRPVQPLNGRSVYQSW